MATFEAPLPSTSLLGGFLWSARISMRQFLNGPRKWVVLLAGAVFPGLLAVFVFPEEAGLIHPFLQLFDQLYLQGILLFIALLGAIPAFSADVEDATVIYLFSRPIPRPAVVVGKWLGAIVPLTFLAMVPVVAAWCLGLAQERPEKLVEVKVRATEESRDVHRTGPDGEDEEELTAREHRPGTVMRQLHPARAGVTGRDLAMALTATALGILEYGTLFFALGVIFARPYIFALSYAVIFEVIIGRASIRFHVISKLIRSATIRLLEPLPGFFESFIKETAPSTFISIVALLVIPILSLAAASFISTRKAYVSKGI